MGKDIERENYIGVGLLSPHFIKSKFLRINVLL